ncbi:MAG: hydroxyacylglutathione hydrolase [Solirubrobacteraceae bacterium]|jgi:glyoxylase-like metal-dependent hydrolase (beta-lactamase superfamily II)|nr:hydroxyacylglutathione hydrolase [Solirubrobacteraceae bacterium]
MKEVADDVWVLPSFPPHSINAWVGGDVLFDAQTRRDGNKIVKNVGDRKLTAHALTHAHPDHQGASHEVCARLGLPYWVPERDADAAEDPSLIRKRQPDHFMARFFDTIFTGPGHPVDRKLVEGDMVGDFRVVDAPGHSAGHVVYWREADKVLILGDVLNSMDVLTMVRGLRLPKDYLTPDPARNRESARKLADLGEPAVVLFGHGPPMRDGKKFRAFCQGL